MACDKFQNGNTCSRETVQFLDDENGQRLFVDANAFDRTTTEYQIEIL